MENKHPYDFNPVIPPVSNVKHLVFQVVQNDSGSTINQVIQTPFISCYLLSDMLNFSNICMTGKTRNLLKVTLIRAVQISLLVYGTL